MKKYLECLLSFLLFLLCSMTSDAAIGDQVNRENLSRNKCYMVSCDRGELTVLRNGSGPCSSTNESRSDAIGANQWAIFAIGNNYYFYNVALKKFLSGDNSMTSAPTPIVISDSKVADKYVLKVASNDFWLNNNNSGNFKFDDYRYENEGNLVTFIEAGDFDGSFFGNAISNITWVVKNGNGETVATETLTGCVEGFSYTTTLGLSYPGVTLDVASVTATNQNQSVTTGYTFDNSVVPFKYSESYENATWYQLKIMRSPAKYCKFNGGIIENVTTAPATLGLEDIFAFVGDPFGFKIYNAKAGKDAPFGPKYSGSGNLVPSTDSNSATFVFEYSSENNGFQLMRNIDNPIGYLNDVSSKLGYWISANNRHDGGSNFVYIEVPEEVTSALLDKAIDVTYNIYLDDELIATKVVKENRGEAPSFSLSDISYISSEGIPSVITGTQTTFDIRTTYTSDFPFESGKWYELALDRSPNLKIYTTKGVMDMINTQNVDKTAENWSCYMWRIDGDWYNGFKLYNKASDAFVSFGSADPANKTKAYLTKSEEPGCRFEYVKNGSYHLFRLKGTGTDAYISNNGGASTTFLTNWNTNYNLNDSGAHFVISEAEEMKDDDISIFTAALQRTLDEVALYEKIPVLYSSEDVATAVTALNAIECTKASDVDAAVAAMDPIVEKLVKTAEHKKFVAKSTFQGIHYLKATPNIIEATTDNIDPTAIFELEYAGNKTFYLKGVYNNVYVNQPMAYNEAPLTSATPLDKYMVNTYTGKTNNVYFAYSLTGQKAIHYSSLYTNYTCGWNYDQEASQWTIESVSDEEYDEMISGGELGKLIAIAKEALPTYKTSVQDGDYYAGTDANHGLKSHYFVNGTEKTSQKGYECTQGQIDALYAAIEAAEVVVGNFNATDEDIATALSNLAEAKAVCDKKWDPLTDGIYFIINGFADDAPDAAQALKYGENGELLYKRPLVNLEPKQMFEVKVLSWDTDADGDKIPTSAYIKNVASGKYLGGVVNGHNTFSDEPVVISWPVANTQGTTKQAHRFQLQTPTGELFNGVGNKAGCEILTSGAYQWQRSWMFRPADEYYAEYLANKEAMDYQNTVIAALNTPTATQDGDLGSNTWIDGTERTAVAGFETTKERIDALQAAWDAYNADKTAENKTAVDAAMELVNKKWEPLTDGVYFLIPRYGDDQGNKNTLAMSYTDNAAWKLPLVKTNPDFMFEVKIKSTIEDGQLGAVPQTLTIKNVGNGKYLGATNGSAWEYQDEEAVWSYTTFVGSDFFSETKHAHCFGLNIGGKFMTYGTNTAGTQITTTTNAYAWKRAWMFRPAGKYYADYMANKEELDRNNILEPALASINSAITPANHHDNTGTRSFLLGNEVTSVAGLATSKDAVDALQTAYDAVKNGFDAGKTISDLTEEIATLKTAKQVVDSKSNPLVDGYYHIIAEYADDTNNTPGGYAIQYGVNASYPDCAYKGAYNKDLADQIFYVEYDSQASKVYLKNVSSGMYLGKVNADNRWEFTTDKVALNIVSGNAYNWYWGESKTVAARACSFILTDDNAQAPRSSTSAGSRIGTQTNVTKASQAWTIAWAFRPAEFVPQDEHGWSMQYVPVKTPYASTVTPDNVLAEYPRPQMVRNGNWVNLNGLWDFKNLATFDQELPEAGYKDILVPFCVESALSGIKKHYENMVYRRNVTIPSDWNGKRMLLHFGAVDWKCAVEVNGVLAGEHEGGYDPFTLDVTDFVEAGADATVVVRVYDPTDKVSIPRGKQVSNPGGIFYTACSGIWQTVWMEAVNNSYISDFTIKPDVDNSSVTINVAGTNADGNKVKATIYHKGTEVASQIGNVGSDLVITISNPDLWTPDHPFLYDVKLQMLNGANITDEVDTYFGMRKIHIEKDKNGHVRTMLNNQFVFQMGPLDQGYWPESNLTPPSDEAIQNDIRVMKQMGFNMVRKHIKVEPARWYYWCDKMGLLVWQDMPSMNYGGPGNISNDATIFTKELKAMINNLKNVPSIVTWVIFNEAGGQHNTKTYVDLVRSLDKSRLINEASGWTHYGYGDIKDDHPYPAPKCPSSNGKQALACGEYGGVRYAIDGHLWNGSGWGYASVADAQEYDDTYLTYTNQLAMDRENKGLCVAVYTQLTDVEIEVNGLMTYDRIIKSDISKILESNRIAIGGIGTSEDYLLSTADEKPETWKYTTAQPATGWNKADFNDASWASGKAGFGASLSNINTSWKSSDIWLRKTVTLDIAEEELELLRGRIFNDEDIELYINGVLAYSATGYLTSYKSISFNQAALDAINKNGDNIFAAHVKQTSGGQYFDLGLFLFGQRPAAPKTKEVVINMDYSKSSEVSVKIGYSLNVDATEPDVWHEYTRLPVEAAVVGLDDNLLQSPTDLRYDITNLTQGLNPDAEVKFFVYINTTEGEGSGTAYSCSLIDYTKNADGEATDLMTSETRTLQPASSVLLTAILNDSTTGVTDTTTNVPSKVDVYSIDGRLIRTKVSPEKALEGLAKGLYIVGGKTLRK